LRDADRECPGNKVENVLVITIPAARPRSDMGPPNLQSGILCHVGTSCPENVVEDRDGAYDLARLMAVTGYIVILIVSPITHWTLPGLVSMKIVNS
jgi:hypothetical protein